MGRRHLQVARNLGLEIAGVYDPLIDSVQLACNEYGLPEASVFSSAGEMIKNARPEVLVVSSTAPSHCEYVCLAAEMGVKYILCEKPMAVSIAECDRMIETCHRHGAKFAINHQMRFMEQYTEPKRMFATEAFGGLASMTIVGGNFGFAMNGTHYFEAFRFLTDEDPVEVTAWFSPGFVPNPRGTQFQDRAGCIRAITASGKRLYMEVGADQGHGLCAIYACRNGMITVNELTGELFSTEREEEYRELPTTRYGMPAVNNRRAIQPAEVIDTSAAMLTALMNDTNSMSGEEGRRVVELLVAAYQSAEQGNIPVRLDGKLDRSRAFPWA